MEKRFGAIILLALVVTGVTNANKNFKKCFESKCQNTAMNRKCCHLGKKLARRSYSCSVDTVLSTQTYLRSLQQKIHSKTTLPVNKLFIKVRQCKRYENCLQCCCMHHKRRLLSKAIYRKLHYDG